MKPVWTGMNSRGWKFRAGELDLCWTWDGMMIAAAGSHKHWFGFVWNYFTTLFWITKSTSPTFDSQDGNEEGLKILAHFSVPPTSCHAKTINKNTTSLLLFDIEYWLHTNVRRKSIVYLRLVQYSLILGSPVPCWSDSWLLTQATVGWKYQSYCRAMHFQGNEGKWNQL